MTVDTSPRTRAFSPGFPHFDFIVPLEGEDAPQANV